MTPNAMPKAIAKNLEFLSGTKRKPRTPRPIRNTALADQLKQLNLFNNN